MAILIDRRLNEKYTKSENKKLFEEYHDRQIHRAIEKRLLSKSLDETSKDSKDNLEIILEDLADKFKLEIDHFNFKKISLKNNKYKVFDRINKFSSNGQGIGGKGTEDFIFNLTRKELEKYLFDGLSLPEFDDKKEKTIIEYQKKYSGVVKSGIPTNLDVIKSVKNGLARNLALQASYEEEINKLEQEFKTKTFIDDNCDDEVAFGWKIEDLKREKECIPFLDDVDLRYRFYEEKPILQSKAVIFLLLDVSGSMNEARKHRAKLFFYLTYLLIINKYKNIEVVFIKHTDAAQICSEKDFFYATENGSTVLSSAQNLMIKLIKEKYFPSIYNIFCLQASDSETFNDDLIAFKENTNYLAKICKLYVYLHVSDKGIFPLAPFPPEHKKTNLIFRTLLPSQEVYRVFRRVFSYEK